MAMIASKVLLVLLLVSVANFSSANAITNIDTDEATSSTDKLQGYAGGVCRKCCLAVARERLVTRILTST